MSLLKRGWGLTCSPCAERVCVCVCPPLVLSLSSPCPPLVLSLSSPCPPLSSPCPPLVLPLSSPCPPLVLSVSSPCPPLSSPLSSPCPPLLLCVRVWVFVCVCVCVCVSVCVRWCPGLVEIFMVIPMTALPHHRAGVGASPVFALEAIESNPHDRSPFFCKVPESNHLTVMWEKAGVPVSALRDVRSSRCLSPPLQGACHHNFEVLVTTTSRCLSPHIFKPRKGVPNIPFFF